jgi:hypothetical protein
MSTEADISQVRTHFLLGRLPSQLRSDVLSDPEVAAAVGGVNQPVNLSSDIVVSCEELLNTLRKIFDGEVCDHLTGLKGDRIDVEVSLETDGTGVITVGRTRWRFVHADLLARNPERRMAAFERVAATYTLTVAEEEAWRARLQSAALDDESFSVLTAAIDATPETFAGKLEEALDKRDVSPQDLLPNDISYWDRLVPNPGASATLTEYIATELDERRRVWLQRDVHAGLRRSALEFAAPGLVPNNLLDPFAGDLSVALASLADLSDHFALVGAFEICARRAAADARLVPVGTRLLDRLLSPIERLEARCAVFGAAFVIGTARLATHEELRRRPLFWRRLAAATQASLVARTAGVEGANSRKVLEWAIRVAGGPFLVSCLLDRAIEPCWRPEWISGSHLAADAVGRILNAWRGVDETERPDEWRPFAEVAEAWITNTGNILISMMPAVLEGGLQRGDVALERLPESFAQTVANFLREPTPAHAIALAPLVFIWGVPDDVATALRIAIESGLRALPPDSKERQLIVGYGAHVAVERTDTALADTVAQACLETALYSTDRTLIRAALLTLIECTGAYTPDREDDLLAARLERLALWRRNPLLPGELGAIVPHLKHVRASLRTHLSRALAALQLAPVQF